MDDDELLARSARDPAAFGDFYARHERLVLGYFMRRTHDPELAADLSAETFAAALLGAKRFRGGGVPASAWLIGIARNILSQSFRRARWKIARGASSGCRRWRSTTTCSTGSSASAATTTSNRCSRA